MLHRISLLDWSFLLALSLCVFLREFFALPSVFSPKTDDEIIIDLFLKHLRGLPEQHDIQYRFTSGNYTPDVLAEALRNRRERAVADTLAYLRKKAQRNKEKDVAEMVRSNPRSL